MESVAQARRPELVNLRLGAPAVSVGPDLKSVARAHGEPLLASEGPDLKSVDQASGLELSDPMLGAIAHISSPRSTVA